MPACSGKVGCDEAKETQHPKAAGLEAVNSEVKGYVICSKSDKLDVLSVRGEMHHL